MRTLTVAISPCPNDVWIFGAWILGLVRHEPPEGAFAFRDVETLNRAALAGTYDLVKVSAATALELGERYRILPSGGAFGLGDGPKLVTRADFSGRPKSVAAPGMRTTALAVLRAALAEPGAQAGPDLPDRDADIRPMRYDAIVPAVLSGQADAGLLIHETALVFENYGLRKTLDLGDWWAEAAEGAPLPLGCIIIRKSLGTPLREAMTERLRQSVDAAARDPGAVMPLIRAMAREQDQEVIDRHIAAYVNPLSREMGAAGAKALTRLDLLLKNDRKWRDCRLPAFDESW